MYESVETYIMRHFTADGERALQRLEQIIEICQGDDLALKLIEDLINSAEHYFASVVKMEVRLKIARFRVEGQEYRDLAETLDRNRSLAHNALLSDLHILNRYLFKEYGEDIPAGGIFSGEPEAVRDRVAVGDWAGQLLYGLYDKRKR